MVAPPTGDEGKVSIPIGAAYDKASTDAATAQFEADIKKAMEAIKLAMQEAFMDGVKLPAIPTEQLKQMITPESLQVSAKALEEAWKRLGEEASKETEAIKQEDEALKQKTATLQGAAAATQGTAAATQQANAATQQATTATQQATAATQQAASTTQQATVATQQGTSATQAATSTTSGFGNVLTYVFGTVLGLTAIGAIRNFINIIKETIAMGEDYIATLFRMSVAVRALQRGGLEITLEDVNKQITELNQAFPQFSVMALSKGITNAMLFTANLKMSKDQINEMIKASITLAAVMGRDVNEVMRTMALTLSSGYSEGLQRLGININKVVITEKAHTMGIKEGYQAMTQYQRAIAALALITEQTAKMQEDAAKFQNTAAGMLATGMAKIETAQATLAGPHVAAIWSKFVFQIGDLVLTVSTLFDSLLHIFEVFERRIVTVMAVAAAAVIGTLKTIREGGGLEELKKNINDIYQVANRQGQYEVDVLFQPEKLAKLGNVDVLKKYTMGLTEEEQQKVVEATDTIEEKLANIVQDGLEKRLKLEEDYASDLEQITTDLQRKLEDAETEHQRNMEQIDIKAMRNREDAALELSRNLAEDAIKYEQDITDAKEKHRQRELDDEADYQRKLKRMQQELSFDLEEAIGSRDIKSAFRILRRYKLDYSQAQEDFSVQQKERDVAFQRELQQLERQRVQRAAQRQREYQQRLQDIARQAEQDRADEIIRYQRQQIDLQARAEQERKDRLLKYQQQLEDLAKSQEDQYKKLAESLVKQYNLTAEMVQAVYAIYFGVYGPGGEMDKLYKYMVESAQRAAEARNNALGSKGSTTTTTGEGTTGTGYAEGGIVIASRPTTLTLGERGMEVAQITPLSYIGRNTNKVYGSIQGGASNQLQSSIRLDILLSKDLEARVIDTALDRMSDVMVSVERER